MIGRVTARGQAAVPADTMQAAQAFEALMLRQLLQPMLPQAGAAAPLAIDALAGQLATASPFGLAALIGTRP